MHLSRFYAKPSSYLARVWSQRVWSPVWCLEWSKRKKKERKHLRVRETARNALLSSWRLAVPFGLLDLFNFSLMLGRSRAFTERKLCRSVGWCCATQTAADVLRGGDRYWESAQRASASLPLPACGCGSPIQTITAARSRQTPAFVSPIIFCEVIQTFLCLPVSEIHISMSGCVKEQRLISMVLTLC